LATSPAFFPNSENSVKSLLKITLVCLAFASVAFAEEKAAPAAEAEFDIPVPLGMPVKGIKIPHRDANGKLLMVFEAEVAKKLDDARIEMDDLKIESFDDEGRKVFVQVAHSIFNLESRILVGDSRTLIRRDDFEITGDSVEFDTRSRDAKMRGNIKMTILTADKLP